MLLLVSVSVVVTAIIVIIITEKKEDRLGGSVIYIRNRWREKLMSTLAGWHCTGAIARSNLTRMFLFSTLFGLGMKLFAARHRGSSSNLPAFV